MPVARYCKHGRARARILSEHSASRPPNRMIVAGFDLEWPFQPREQRVSLMQICVRSDRGRAYTCYLFQLSEIGKLRMHARRQVCMRTGPTQCVIDLLNNDRVLLTGVALLQ